MDNISKKYLGIELGSTRIKAVLIDEEANALASGASDWENRYENGYWTYSLEDVWDGVRSAYSGLLSEYRRRYGEALSSVDGLGVSAMMHGYLPFGKDGELLAPFRTWRNTTTEQSAALLTERFGFNIPQRWSIAHLYQAILNNEPHVKDISFITTLAGYVHWKLTGEKALGIGDASGMFPIDSGTGAYDAAMVKSFAELTGIDVTGILPRIIYAGKDAGSLTAEGANLLDPGGSLKPGTPVCPPEGDAGTGMVATNSVAAHTGNISAGTSVFTMIVLKKALSRLYTEVDMVTTPAGLPVAMVHCNSCTSDLDAWVKLFGEAAELMGARFDKSELYGNLYKKALEGDLTGGGLVSFNYYAGEPITGLGLGRPLFARLPDSPMSLANFMRVQLYSAMATLSLGMEILTGKEQVKLDVLFGHGGLFKTPGVGQKIMADALNVPVAVHKSASEGGAWGISLLAAYRGQEGGRPLEQYLENVFKKNESVRVNPEPAGTEGFKAFMRRYAAALEIERAAVEKLV
jgi:sugar (pentulose or hexulose) kinase